jgi:RHS repeat-associated protein
MPGRSTNGDKYRYGYNGMEMDNEAKGNGNSYTTEFRQYDPRLGRWLSLDPLMMQFPSMSPYVAFNDNPIFFTDPLGLAAEGGPEGEEGDPPPTNSKGDWWGWEKDPVMLDEVVIATDSKETRAAKIAASEAAIAAAENKFWGGVEFFLGAAEVVGGALMCTNPATAPLGVISIVHGADNMSAGLTQSITGETTETFTHRGARVISEKAGANKETANNIATGVDMAIGTIGAAGPVKAGPTIVKVVTAEETATQVIVKTEQIVTNGVNIPKGSVRFSPQATQAAHQLGFYAEDISVVNGVAEVPITYMSSASIAHIGVLKSSLKALGAKSMRIYTGPIVNPGLSERIEAAFNAGKTFAGFNITRGAEQKSFILQSGL